MKFFQSFIPAFLVVGATCSPTQTIEKRATTICGQWDSVQTGTYIVYQNLWGKGSATSGSQCTTYNSLSGTNLAWSTSWTWAGGAGQVKSYANVVVSATVRQLSAVKTLASTWKWSYTGSSVIANVAYDLFTSSTTTGSPQYEIMIWLGAIGGAGPISSTGSPIATITIAGTSWKLYKGLNGSMNVFSFVASSQVTSFSADINLFLTYLRSSQGLPASQYLQSIGAGTETFTGSNAVFTASQYSIVVT
ncbi:glycoside hydrolase family 12 protein [Bisporella sp. PMI_857]|nr:glycoside hydrolase family 12 protein [Bisporella sp. PMI_857]KAH8600294.1 glycoside hydrolase family 12 protein [Bisporella sp. PMI_857]